MIITFEPEEMLRKGLLLRRDYDSNRFNKICKATKMADFKGDYGVVPKLACALWKDLQTCDTEANRINPKKVSSTLPIAHHTFALLLT